MKERKVFLGGTCNNSKWRDELIPNLTVDYFNPVVDDWTPEAAKKEVLAGLGKINYTCQCLIYNSNTGRADSWVPSSSDIFAKDWEEVK